MAEDNFTLSTFYTFWKEYQDHIKAAIVPLTAEQLELRAAPHLRSIGEKPCTLSAAVHSGSSIFLAKAVAQR